MLANLTAQPTFAEDLDLTVGIITSLNKYDQLEIFVVTYYVPEM